MLIDVWKVLRKIRTLTWVGKINIALNVWRTRKYKIRLVAIIAVKNEQRYLPGFFQHLLNYVDGFIVLDDGSSDDTVRIIKSEPSVLLFMKNNPGGGVE